MPGPQVSRTHVRCAFKSPGINCPRRAHPSDRMQARGPGSLPLLPLPTAEAGAASQDPQPRGRGSPGRARACGRQSPARGSRFHPAPTRCRHRPWPRDPIPFGSPAQQRRSPVSTRLAQRQALPAPAQTPPRPRSGLGTAPAPPPAARSRPAPGPAHSPPRGRHHLPVPGRPGLGSCAWLNLNRHWALGSEWARACCQGRHGAVARGLHGQSHCGTAVPVSAHPWGFAHPDGALRPV